MNWVEGSFHYLWKCNYSDLGLFYFEALGMFIDLLFFWHRPASHEGLRAKEMTSRISVIIQARSRTWTN